MRSSKCQPPIRVVAEVRVDAERQVGEVAEPRQHPLDVVGRQAVDQQRLDAELLEPLRSPAEEVALGPAPVLAVHAADAVAAAAEAEPHGQAGLEDSLDAANVSPSRISDIVSSRIRSGGSSSNTRAEQRERLQALLDVDVAVDAEGDRAPPARPAFVHGLSGERDARPGDVHPVRRPVPDGPPASRSAAARIAHVLVVITSQPAST